MSTSPSHLNSFASNGVGAGELMIPYYTPPHAPYTPNPASPLTPRPMLDTINGMDDSPPNLEDGYPTFNVTTILPNFLYLGPEPTAPEHVEELRELGVKRILNIAAECRDDHGLGMRDVFKYVKIPMQDTLQEDNVAWAIREACSVLDNARLNLAPIYVHCKASESRSITAVMAYLIHANHWTLTHAYAFVLERRKGISLNIGFMAELMTFEYELGERSVGVQPSAPTGNGDGTRTFLSTASPQASAHDSGSATDVSSATTDARDLTEIAANRGFFAGSGHCQLMSCTMNDVRGDAQFNNYHIGSTPTALVWAQLLISAPQSALITGYGGYFYLKHHFSGDTKSIGANCRNGVINFALYHDQMRDLGFTFVNVMMLCFMIFRAFVARR
ncbi:hypothetical protein AX14_005868 [Amanita brunnescens Koide BX004]|nr:hypothetical protein AX14_005868 [Amanita brunnescens Koide BX004]